MALPKPDLEFLSDGTGAILAEDYTVLMPFLGSVTVPEGTFTDGASIPRVFWVLVGPPFRGTYLPAALVHDWLCDLSTDYESRIIADACFRWLLTACGIGRFKRLIFYLAVRIGGRRTWEQRRRNRAVKAQMVNDGNIY